MQLQQRERRLCEEALHIPSDVRYSFIAKGQRQPQQENARPVLDAAKTFNLFHSPKLSEEETDDALFMMGFRTNRRTVAIQEDGAEGPRRTVAGFNRLIQDLNVNHSANDLDEDESESEEEEDLEELEELEEGESEQSLKQETGQFARDQQILRAARDAFERLDTDCSGVLDFEEFCEALSTMMGLQIPEKEAQALFDSTDSDGSGEVDFDEFHGAYRRLQDKDANNRDKHSDAIWSQLADMAADEHSNEMVAIFSRPAKSRDNHVENEKATEYIIQKLQSLVCEEDTRWFQGIVDLLCPCLSCCVAAPGHELFSTTTELGCVIILRGSLLIREKSLEPRFPGGKRQLVGLNSDHVSTLYGPGCVLGKFSISAEMEFNDDNVPLECWPESAVVVGYQELKYLEIDRHKVRTAIAAYLENATSAIRLQVSCRTDKERACILALLKLAQMTVIDNAAPELRGRFTELITIRHFPRGGILVAANSPAENQFIVLSGRLLAYDPPVKPKQKRTPKDETVVHGSQLHWNGSVAEDADPVLSLPPPSMFPADGNFLDLDPDEMVWNQQTLIASPETTVAVVSKHEVEMFWKQYLSDAAGMMRAPSGTNTEAEILVHLWRQHLIKAVPEISTYLEHHLWKSMLAYMQLRCFSNREIIYAQGEAPEGILLVLRGEVLVHSAINWKRSSCLSAEHGNHSIRAGQVLGALMYLDIAKGERIESCPRNMRATAVGEVEGIWLPMDAEYQVKEKQFHTLKQVLSDPPEDRAPSNVAYVMHSLKEKLPIFQGMQERRCMDICRHIKYMEFAPGEIVALEGLPCNHYHFLLRGIVSIVKPRKQAAPPEPSKKSAQSTQPASKELIVDPPQTKSPRKGNRHRAADGQPILERARSKLVDPELCKPLLLDDAGSGSETLLGGKKPVLPIVDPHSRTPNFRVGDRIPLPVPGMVGLMRPGTGTGESALLAADVKHSASLVAVGEGGKRGGVTIMLRISRRNYLRAMSTRTDDKELRLDQANGRVHVLKKIKLFQCFSERQIMQLAYFFKPRQSHLHEQLTEFGKPARSVFVILEGTVNLSIPVQNSCAEHRPGLPKEANLAVLRAVCVVGYEAAAMQSLHKVNTRVATPCEVLEITEQRFRAVFQSNDGAHTHMLKCTKEANLLHAERLEQVLEELNKSEYRVPEKTRQIVQTARPAPRVPNRMRPIPAALPEGKPRPSENCIARGLPVLRVNRTKHYAAIRSDQARRDRENIGSFKTRSRPLPDFSHIPKQAPTGPQTARNHDEFVCNITAMKPQAPRTHRGKSRDARITDLEVLHFDLAETIFDTDQSQSPRKTHLDRLRTTEVTQLTTKTFGGAEFGFWYTEPPSNQADSRELRNWVATKHPRNPPRVREANCLSGTSLPLRRGVPPLRPSSPEEVYPPPETRSRFPARRSIRMRPDFDFFDD